LDECRIAGTPVRDDELALIGLKLARSAMQAQLGEQPSNLAVEALSTVVAKDSNLHFKWARRVRERINAEFSESVRIAAIAREEGVHPVYLARSFRQHYGCTISSYLQRRRRVEVLRTLQY